MLKHASCDTDCNSLRWDGFKDVCMEHWRDDINDQHKHRRNLQRDGYGYERMHGFRFRYINRQSESHSLSQ